MGSASVSVSVKVCVCVCECEEGCELYVGSKHDEMGVRMLEGEV